MASRVLLASNLIVTIVVIIMPACENYSYEIQTHKEYLSGKSNRESTDDEDLFQDEEGTRLAITILLNAVPLGTCEKAKACEYRESETCN